MIKSIQTFYKGYKFRSRLEARWAVFFEALGVKWEYEKEGFVVNGKPYLPDFWIEDWQMWIEIKPANIRKRDREAVWKICQELPDHCLLIVGNPWRGEHRILYSAWAHEMSWPDWLFDSFCECRRCPGVVLFMGDEERGCVNQSFIGQHADDCDGEKCPWLRLDDRAGLAYAAARSARFEHGEVPH